MKTFLLISTLLSATETPVSHYINKNLTQINLEEDEKKESEKNNHLLSWWKTIQENTTEYIPDKIRSLRCFVNKLRPLFEPSMEDKIFGFDALEKDSIEQDPLELLWYLYNLQYHKDSTWPFTLTLLNTEPTLLKECQKAEIKGFSPFSATIIAPNITPEDKKNIIKKLLTLGFKITERDKEFAYLELYERNLPNKVNIMLLFAGCLKNPESPLSQLPRDIIKYIAKKIIEEKSLLE